ncbi:transporter substrate-binding domain-containing protein [Oricola thermophila]|uniref:Transporter substrate-binding domain-containing protein n=1 Tax=Oricola thermophila TaxID=2742145 RepID=A0A6N1VDP5_9HYPH|nr:transporter substrate-binding domain-containing protein [Oricola thermophila]QKV18964.1 transporter substrate-binding domain-containing protein [Oricola thermophila]
MKPAEHFKMALAGLACAFVVTTAYAGEALDRVMETKVLKVATSANWAPQSFLNEQNEMDGFDVDVAKEIAKRLGVEVEFVTPAWDVITAGNWNGRWDISVGSMTPTAKRAEVLAFPAIYYYTPAAVAVHRDSKAVKPSDLDGKVVGACANCTYELYLKRDLTIDAVGVPTFEYQIAPGEIRSYQGPQPAFDDLRLGNGTRLDGLVEGLPAINDAIETGYPIKVIGEPLFYEPLALAIDLGDGEFNDVLAGIVADMKADGTMTALSMKWYGFDYTKAE